MRHLLLLTLLLQAIIPAGMMPDMAGWAAGGPALAICRGGAGQVDGTDPDDRTPATPCPFALVTAQAFIAPLPLAAPALTHQWQPVAPLPGPTSIPAYTAALGHRLARGPPAWMPA